MEVTGPPAEVNEIARLYQPEGAPAVVGMDVEKDCIAATMITRRPTIFVGHSGIGKTLTIKRTHQEKGWPYHSLPGHAQVEVDTLVGKIWIAGGTMQFRPGILPFCMTQGIALGIQEINAIVPEALIFLHQYLDEGRVTITDLPPDHPDYLIDPHPNFRLYGSMNPPEWYPGTRDLSPALARRCNIRNVEPLESALEQKVVLSQVPEVDELTVRRMSQVAASCRKNLEENKMSFFLSTADLVQWAELTVLVGSPHRAAEMAIYGKAPREDVGTVKTFVRTSMGAPS